MDRLIPSSTTLQEDLAASEPLQRGDDEMLPPPATRRNLYFAAMCANLGSISAGCAMAWSSPAIPNMKAAGLIDDDQGSWLTSLLGVGAALGPFMAYRLVDKIGRKTTILLDMVLFVLSWVLLGFAPLISSSLPRSVTVPPISIMYLSRFLTGVAAGCTFMVTPLYIAEISDTYVRSALGSLMQMFLSIGFLIEYCIGPYYSASVLVGSSLVPPLLCLAAFLLVPESPLYLLATEDTEGASKALMWLRQTQDVYLETVEIQKSLEESRTTPFVTWGGLVTKSGHLKCLSYGIALVFFQQLSGINVVLFYSESIFRMTSSDMSSAVCTIIVGFVFVFAASSAPPLTRRFGMKNLLVFSSLCAVIFQGVLAAYFFLDQQKADLKLFHWVPVTCIVLYLITFSIGLGPLPWALMAEVYSPPIKAKGSALTASTCWLLTFLLTKFFPGVSLSLGPGLCFAAFAAFCVLASVYTRLVLPDTRGMTLAQIQRLMYGARG